MTKLKDRLQTAEAIVEALEGHTPGPRLWNPGVNEDSPVRVYIGDDFFEIEKLKGIIVASEDMPDDIVATIEEEVGEVEYE